MSFLVVGMSHKSAPIAVLEQAALDHDAVIKLLHKALDGDHVSESVIISTCNRVEIYVETDRFHGSVEEISALLADHSNLPREGFVTNAYVHYDEAAVAHLFAVTAGLDSMVVGESQILGQVRTALQVAQTEGTVGALLNTLFQQSLRIGKRGHAETGIDRLGASVVSEAFDLAGAALIGANKRFLVAGAGSMAGLAVATLLRRDIRANQITVVNRTRERAQRLAAVHGVKAADWSQLDVSLQNADILISCTGAGAVVFDGARIGRTMGDRPVTLVDLAVPHDVDQSVGDLDNVNLIDIATLAQILADTEIAADVTAVRTIVSDEVAAFLAARNASQVTPTVVALRMMATEVVAAELERLQTRHHDLDDDLAADIRQTMKRIADKLIHNPTVRVQELAAGPDGLSYANALADLFSLDPAVVTAVTRINDVGVDA